MTNNEVRRVQAGAPQSTGGQFDTKPRGEVEVSLGKTPKTPQESVDAVLDRFPPLDYSNAIHPESRATADGVELRVSGPSNWKSYIRRSPEGDVVGLISAPLHPGGLGPRYPDEDTHLDLIASQYGGSHARESLVAAFEAAEAAAPPSAPAQGAEADDLQGLSKYPQGHPLGGNPIGSGARRASPDAPDQGAEAGERKPRGLGRLLRRGN